MMGNAPSDLKARAQMVAPPCSEDGVLAVLEQLLW
jgi:hydroxymethylpyrimidine pyrophosphatase-like HAD family hydrolase